MSGVSGSRKGRVGEKTLSHAVYVAEREGFCSWLKSSAAPQGDSVSSAEHAEQGLERQS